MKKALFLILTVFFAMFWVNSAMALPHLQLDADPSIYIDGSGEGLYDEDTVYATANPFNLFALINPDHPAYNASDIYYISAAIAGEEKITEDINFNLGSFIFNGVTVNVTDNGMEYGTAPLDEFITLDPIKNNYELGSHSIYDTYFKEFSFSDFTGTIAPYNVEPGSTDQPSNSSDLSYKQFLVDITGLASGYSVHFDLYTKNADGTINSNAPFSHDVQSGGDTAPVPEPATMLLLGSGLMGIGWTRRKKKNS
ncbi:choice-of-anchor N protein [Desulfobacterales bacterium HSG17]|nr:choice-of-anchor N protein [Desulfobacterales bacterium HSG17]